jgi:hypothetical protein
LHLSSSLHLPPAITCLIRLANAYRNNGTLEDAELLYQQAMVVYAEQQGKTEEHTEVA